MRGARLFPAWKPFVEEVLAFQQIPDLIMRKLWQQMSWCPSSHHQTITPYIDLFIPSNLKHDLWS
jgi:hypothetical protein